MMRAMDMAYSCELNKTFVSTVKFTVFAVDNNTGTVVWKKEPVKNWVVQVFAVQIFIITFTNPNNIHFWDSETGDNCWHLNMPFLNVDMKSDYSANYFCVPTSELIQSSDNRISGDNHQFCVIVSN